MSAKATRLIVATTLSLIAIFAVYQYTQTPLYKNRQAIKEAQKALADNDVSHAADLFASVALSATSVAQEGEAGLRGLIDPDFFSLQPAGIAAQIVSNSKEVQAVTRTPLFTKESLLAHSWKLIETHKLKDSVGAKALLNAISSLESNKEKLATTNESLLEAIVQAGNKHVTAASELAEILERRNDCSRCEALLFPHATQLGKSEGARILGQIYGAKGKIEESYALLLPYTEEKLKLFTDSESAYRKTGERLEKAAIEDLRTGKAPAHFYDRYEKASEQHKREMVGRYIDEQLSRNNELKQSIDTLRRASAVVPVALDLGIVMVQRANKFESQDQRTKEFEAAEKIFLAIKGAAGNSNEYRFYLGQVSYWLGKQEEGKRLFDELLATNKRSYSVLMNIASLLRSVGAQTDARALAEEAFRTAASKEERWDAAHLRSVMFRDTEDELAWLEKCDPSNARIQASTYNARGSIALAKGQRSTAKQEYEQAIAAFSKLPESAAQLNSTALVHLMLYGMEGDTASLEKGLALLDRALELMPSDSILLLNNISVIGSAATRGIIGDKIDLAALKTSSDLELLDYLHNDEATRNKLAQQVLASAGVKKALAYSDKASLLAPRNPNSYGFPIAAYGFIEDANLMRPLLGRIQAAQLDLKDSETAINDVYAGKNLKSDLEKLKAREQSNAALLRQPAVTRSAPTWAVASGQWINSQTTLAGWGQAINPDDLVVVARKAKAMHPSSATHSNLMTALETRAVLRLMKQSPELAKNVAQYGKVIRLSDLLVLHMYEDPEFLKLALAEPDVAELLAMVRDRDGRYPNKASIWSWMLAKNIDRKYADTLAGRIRQNEFTTLYTQLSAMFSPRHPAIVIGQYTTALMKGDEQEALRIVTNARNGGIPLPGIVGKRLTKT